VIYASWHLSASCSIAADKNTLNFFLSFGVNLKNNPLISKFSLLNLQGYKRMQVDAIESPNEHPSEM
jgi:hypothetical protein